MEPKHLLILGETYAAHIDRTLNTVCRRAGVHARFFARIAAGKGCHVQSFNHVLRWFDENWPRDLEWPRHILRPATPPKTRKDAA